jgi:hypothetical protein
MSFPSSEDRPDDAFVKSETHGGPTRTALETTWEPHLSQPGAAINFVFFTCSRIARRPQHPTQTLRMPSRASTTKTSAPAAKKAKSVPKATSKPASSASAAPDSSNKPSAKSRAKPKSKTTIDDSDKDQGASDPQGDDDQDEDELDDEEEEVDTIPITWKEFNMSAKPLTVAIGVVKGPVAEAKAQTKSFTGG